MDGGVRVLVDEEILSILAKFFGERLVPGAGNTIVESVRKDRSIIPMPPNLVCPVRSFSHTGDEVLGLHDKVGMVRTHYCP
jgi:hypothetical protein